MDELSQHKRTCFTSSGDPILGLDTSCGARVQQPVMLTRRPEKREETAWLPSGYPMRCPPCVGKLILHAQWTPAYGRLEKHRTTVLEWDASTHDQMVAVRSTRRAPTTCMWSGQDKG